MTPNVLFNGYTYSDFLSCPPLFYILIIFLKIRDGNVMTDLIYAQCLATHNENCFPDRFS